MTARIALAALLLLAACEQAEPERRNLTGAFSLLDTADDECARLWRRYQRRCGSPVPIPSPTHSPRPTQVPQACEPVSVNTVKTFQPGPAPGVPGETKVLCFDVKETKEQRPHVGVQSTNDGNTSCAQYAAQLQGPDGGLPNYSLGVAPQNILQHAGTGRYYLSVTYVWGSCPTLRFTVAP